jgi:hypothetical protein
MDSPAETGAAVTVRRPWRRSRAAWAIAVALLLAGDVSLADLTAWTTRLTSAGRG